MHTKFAELVALSHEGLRSEIVTCRKALFNLRFQSKMESQGVKAHQFRVYRRQIARLKTAIVRQDVSVRRAQPSKMSKKGS